MRSAPPRPTRPSSFPPAADVVEEVFDCDDASETVQEESALSGFVRPVVPPPPPQLEIDRVIDVAADRIRCFGLLRQNCPVHSAFGKAAHLALHGAMAAAERALDGYYGYAPLSAADVLRLDTQHELHDYPPLAAVLPWEAVEPDARLRAMEEATVGHQQQTARTHWGVTDGHTQFGPVSRRKLAAEVERLRALVESVRSLGISANHPLPLGMMVVDDRRGADAWVFDVRDGLHRCAVFGALVAGTPIKVQVVADLGPTVRRSGSATWHGVQTGLFTEEEALNIFDRYFEGML